MTRRNGDRDRLVAINTEARRYFREQLLTSPAAQGPCGYLTHRRLAHVLAADSPWPVGYAPAGWTRLTDHLTRVGFSSEDLLAAGIACRTRTGGIVDRFRDRIMFAQRNPAGDTVGFIGRAAPGAPPYVPKYLNSPRTAIYNKRELLFGLYEHRGALASGARPVLVEGPLDVLAITVAFGGHGSHLAAVASCGTALTPQQVELLSGHTRSGVGVVVAYDQDEAGHKAASAAYRLLVDCHRLSAGELTAASLPRGTDPAELLQVHSAHALRVALADSGQLMPLAQHAIETELRSWTHVLDGAEGRISAVKAVAPLIRQLPHSQVAQQVTKLARSVNLDPTTVSIAILETKPTPQPVLPRRRITSDGPRPFRTSPGRPPPADRLGHSL